MGGLMELYDEKILLLHALKLFGLITPGHQSSIFLYILALVILLKVRVVIRCNNKYAIVFYYNKRRMPMINKTKILLALALSASLLHAEPVKKDNVHMFPQPKEGFERYVIKVPALDNENDHKVELMIGKTVSVDCNHHVLLGKLEAKPLKGWGYTYLEANNINGMRASTRMACQKANSDKFISLAPSKESMQRYNSRSPIVTYVPKDYEVRYRIWSADKETQQAERR